MFQILSPSADSPGVLYRERRSSGTKNIMDAWEESKENFQPLKEGRSREALEAHALAAAEPGASRSRTDAAKG